MVEVRGFGVYGVGGRDQLGVEGSAVGRRHDGVTANEVILRLITAAFQRRRVKRPVIGELLIGLDHGVRIVIHEQPAFMKQQGSIAELDDRLHVVGYIQDRTAAHEEFFHLAIALPLKGDITDR